MQKLRIIALVFTAALSALTLSVGAAMAEAQRVPAPRAQPDAKPAPSGVCFLHNL